MVILLSTNYELSEFLKVSCFNDSRVRRTRSSHLLERDLKSEINIYKTDNFYVHACFIQRVFPISGLYTVKSRNLWN